jgi:hypothetical protein
MPILLVFAGAASCGLVRGIATVVNGNIQRSDRGTVTRYGLAAVVTVSAAVNLFLFVLAVALSLMMGARK